MRIIDGRKIALSIRKELKEEVAKLKEKPGLAIVLIGDDPGSHVYVSLKEEAAREAGIHFEKYIFPATVSEVEVIELIRQLNSNKVIHGIVIQFPLPEGFSKENIISAIILKKDVDGFHPDNIKALLASKPLIVPGLVAGIMKIIASTGEQLAGKRALVIANSKVFSEPLGYLFEQQGVATEACNPDKSSCDYLSREADILVVAIGRPNLIKAQVVKPGAIVIDVGYNRVNNKPVGDVDFESVKNKVGWITPVPGGVGPMTVAMLLRNVLKVYEIQKR